MTIYGSFDHPFHSMIGKVILSLSYNSSDILYYHYYTF